jgi:hypothetical protein
LASEKNLKNTKKGKITMILNCAQYRWNINIEYERKKREGERGRGRKRK